MNPQNVLKAMAGIYQNKPSPEGIAILLMDLKKYSDSQILTSLKRCRAELNYFPSLSQIIDRMEGQHLGENEAWAICPKDEGSSVCWTPEIKRAFSVALPLLEDGDKIGARMAFLEVYRKEISSSKINQSFPKWELSIGYNKQGRECVAAEALRLGRINLNTAQKYLPQPEISENVLRLTENINNKI